MPGTEATQRVLTMIRGSRRRQVGAAHEAMLDLLPAAELSDYTGVAVHAHSQLAMVPFGASFWDEAQACAAEGAGLTLLNHETVGSLMAYALSALVPAARGQEEAAERILEQPERIEQPGAVVTALIPWVRTWSALAAGDHSRAVKHLLAMRNASAGWWSMGVKPTMLLARELFYTGMPEMLASVARSAQDVPLLQEAHQPVEAYLRAFQCGPRADPRRPWRRSARSGTTWTLSRPCAPPSPVATAGPTASTGRS